LRGPDQQAWLRSLQAEHHNLQAALEWTLDNRETEMSLELAGALWRYWWMHGHFNEGREWLERALALPAGPSAARGRALHGHGILAREQGDLEQARSSLEESLKIQRRLQDKTGLANVLNSLGMLCQYQKDYDQASTYYEESLAYRQETGDRRGIAVSLNNLAIVDYVRRNVARAEALYGKSLELFQEVQDARGIAAAQINLGYIMLELEDAGRADGYFRQSLAVSRSLGQRTDITECLEGLAGVALLRGEPARAARLISAAQTLRKEIGSAIADYLMPRYQWIVETIAAALDPATLERERKLGQALSWDDAVDDALS
jgi:tetratricopeptide (TPR) repeat protein